MSPDPQLWLVALGFGVGVLGTLIGASGGFILVPVLLLLYPHADPSTITSISLAVVFVNATSGSWAYARMKRIDYRSGLIFAAATIPGAVIGAYSTDFIPRRQFNLIFGVLMIAMGLYLLTRQKKDVNAPGKSHNADTTRTLVEADGTSHVYSYNIKLGTGLSVAVGYLSSLLGIGGGIIHVPALAHLLNFPVHVATATSHFILAIMALAGTLVHVLNGAFSQGGAMQTIYLSVGVLFGAQIGARLSSRVRGSFIISSLALAIALVGVRILTMSLKG